jgi:hypothetical protein
LDERHRNLILADGDAGIGQIGAEIAPCVSRSASRPISLIVVAAYAAGRPAPSFFCRYLHLVLPTRNMPSKCPMRAGNTALLGPEVRPETGPT